MYLSVASSSFFPVVLIVLLIVGLSLIIGGLSHIRTIKTRLRAREQELAALQEVHQEQSASLVPAQRTISHLYHLAKQGSLSMLQLAHELRAPLAAIQSALDTVLLGYTEGDAQLQNEMLKLARDRAAVTLEQVNEFLRRGAAQHAESEEKAEPVQLLDVLDRPIILEKRVRAKWNAVELTVEAPDALSMVNVAADGSHDFSNERNGRSTRRRERPEPVQVCPTRWVMAVPTSSGSPTA